MTPHRHEPDCHSSCRTCQELAYQEEADYLRQLTLHAMGEPGAKHPDMPGLIPGDERIAPAPGAEGQTCAQCALPAWHIDTALPFCNEHNQETYYQAGM